MEYEKIEKEVKKILSEKRFLHSVMVAKKAEELAIKYGEDPKIAKIIGVTHDIAKEMTEEEYFDYVEKNNIEIDDIERENVFLLHGKVGADICKKKFGFNEQMQNAVKYHTVGNINMDNMAKIIYLADKIEDTRVYDGVQEAREKTNISLDEGMIFMLARGMKKCELENRIFHSASKELYEKLLEKMVK